MSKILNNLKYAQAASQRLATKQLYLIKETASVNVGRRTIGPGHRVFIIAEAGVNHNGRLELARKIVDAAKFSGADAVKFQTFKAESLVSVHAPQAVYQKKTAPDKNQLNMLKKLELSVLDFKALSVYCRKKKIMFLSTPFDEPSADALAGLHVPAFKVSSGDLTNLPLLKKIARYQRPVLLSTGMATLAEVRDAVRCLQSSGNRRLVLFHCTSNYPAAPKDVNLRAMVTLRREFNVPVGYSDHTLGKDVALAAVAMGAHVIEKHLTLDKNLPGPDHRASCDPAEFEGFVDAIRRIESALGDGNKRPAGPEFGIRRVARKSVVALDHISKDTPLTSAQLTVKRPGTGIEPKYLEKILGRRLKVNKRKDQVIHWKEVL